MSKKGDLQFVANVEKYLVLSGLLHRTALAKRIMVSRQLLHRRLEHPGDLTVNELRRISTVLGMPAEELLSLFK